MAYFVDTSYLLALVHQRDAFHEAAARWQRQAEGRLVTTSYVLLETANGLSHHAYRLTAAALISEIRSASEFRVVPGSEPLMDAGLNLFRSRTDKDWSLTDCISFFVMREQGITEALTADHHFEQAGFKALLRI